jgi:hypothetical protein
MPCWPQILQGEKQLQWMSTYELLEVKTLTQVIIMVYTCKA